ncbi:MAG: rod shape-determining protein MreC [Parcubacteria group bacterium GW2011_GWA2_38_13b]|nr:MAG: rod shape-determining protein MreC [Parcubacteria group bacterium GW2011_GWA2_38_13b]
MISFRNIIIVIALLIIIFTLFFFNFSDENGKFSAIFSIKTLDSTIVFPVKIFSVISKKTTDFFGLFAHISALKHENEQLHLENKKLVVKNIKLEELKIENELLRIALNLEKSEKYDLVPARIIGKDPAALSGFIIIDKGNNFGIMENAAVISQSGVFIGQIKKVNSIYSHFIPVVAPGSSINAITKNSRVQGVLKGRYGLSLILELVPQDKDIQINEAVITSGINDNFPSGILIGYVMDIMSDADKPFKDILIKSGENIMDIEWVYILKN